MTERQWKKRIKKSCENNGTYRDSFDEVINILASTLARRDNAEEIFKESGKQIEVLHTNKAGQSNRVLNPTLKLINELNRDALTYMRDLGLTPAGFKKIQGAELKSEREGTALEQALAKLGAG